MAAMAVEVQVKWRWSGRGGGGDARQRQRCTSRCYGAHSGETSQKQCLGGEGSRKRKGSGKTRQRQRHTSRSEEEYDDAVLESCSGRGGTRVMAALVQPLGSGWGWLAAVRGGGGDSSKTEGREGFWRIRGFEAAPCPAGRGSCCPSSIAWRTCCAPFNHISR